MTRRINQSELNGQIARLNRNIADYKVNLRVKQIDMNGFINLFNDKGSVDYSLGNTKSELYYQVVLANKILEQIRYEKEHD